MKKGSKHITHYQSLDLLAIALACVVSLLFAQGVCHFVDTAKKNNYGGYSEVRASEKSLSVTSFIEVNLNSIQLNIFRKETSIKDFFKNNAPYQFIKRTISNVLNKEIIGPNASAFYKINLTLISGPSIPIVQRRLVI